MKKIELKQRLLRKTRQTQELKLELMLCKLGLTPEMQKRFLESALKQYKHARKVAGKKAKKK